MTVHQFVLVAGDFVRTGGMDRANYALGSFLARAGYRVSLVAHRVAPELARLPGVDLRTVRKPLGSDLLGLWPLARAGRAAGRAASANVRTIVNGGNCRSADICWVHYVHAAYRPLNRTSRFRRAKSALEHQLYVRSEREALGTARLVVCNSERTRQQVVELCGVDPARAITVYYGIDPDQFRPALDSERADLRGRYGWPLDRPVAVFIGGLGDRRKGFDTLFEAWTRLSASNDWDGLLVVIGSGAEQPAWEARTAAIGLSNRILFLGRRTDVPDLLRAADVLIAPTRYEAYGLGVHEALCCGLPCLVSAAAGVAELIPPELIDLLLPDPEDVDDLVSRLRRWRDDPIAARERVRGLSNRLRGYDWDDMGRRFLEAVYNTN